jgi:hypothetical protein
MIKKQTGTGSYIDKNKLKRFTFDSIQFDPFTNLYIVLTIFILLTINTKLTFPSILTFPEKQYPFSPDPSARER